MEKHAFLIGAYKNPDYLLRLVDSLDSERSNIYIHVNKNNDKEFDGFKQKIAKRSNIHYYSVIPVKWGGITMIKSQILLCEEALKNTENIYFHFVTGQDILIKPLSEFFDFFHNSKVSYLSYKPMKKEEIMYRFYNYHLFDIFNINYSKVTVGITLERVLRIIQKIIRLRYEKLPFEKVLIGSPWWSLHRDALMYCTDKLNQNSEILKRFKHTYAPDESIFHSLLLSSEERFAIVNDNLRYIIWDRAYVGGQKLLNVDDFNLLVASNAFFARKVDVSDRKSSELINKLDKHLRQIG